jgi:2-polyprenyl-3-methyl-5-hydroxy-6-metoxy-1,4-benzoquinol methylase
MAKDVRDGNDVEYWSRVYSGDIIDTKVTLQHSSFCLWACEQLCVLGLHPTKENIILDVGCGNGRDSYYLCSMGYTVIGIDSAVCPENKHGALFQQHDALNIPEAILRTAKVIYARFFLHALTDQQQNEFLNRLAEVCMPGTFIVFETRSMNDPMLQEGRAISKNENFTSHYRRYQTTHDIEASCKRSSLKMLHCTEVFNVSPALDDNPALLRGVLCT